MHAPSYAVTDYRREIQIRKEAKAFTRQAILSFVQQGWRESEAALALADELDEYCLYLSACHERKLDAANSN